MQSAFVWRGSEAVDDVKGKIANPLPTHRTVFARRATRSDPAMTTPRSGRTYPMLLRTHGLTEFGKRKQLDRVPSVKVKHSQIICLVQIMCHNHEVTRVALLRQLKRKATNFLMPPAVSRSIVFIESSTRLRGAEALRNILQLRNSPTSPGIPPGKPRIRQAKPVRLELILLGLCDTRLELSTFHHQGDKPLIGDNDPALSKQVLHIPEAECEVQVQQDRELYDRWREPIASVAEHMHHQTLPVPDGSATAGHQCYSPLNVPARFF